ncbi:hypothetical protein [Chitinophaga agri]|uniref:Uncharacterized protein n=1 Tax=Chitinophaga agri TaxID=2703787 RepID=A0A6B9ZPI2_9BACT|nr:hypothetical protein [Chitinophaga agri]QHS63541.1 hypothetical protein GWR21_29350 [Chitinophaga agri]
MTILSEVTLPEKYIPLFQLPLRTLVTTINAEREETTKHLKTRLTELEEKIDKLEERYIEEKITEELHKKFADKYGTERKKLLEELQSSPIK